MPRTVTADPHRTEAGTERARILEILRHRCPELAARTVTGPSGALLVPAPDGRTLEVGRLPRRGRTRWVVVEPAAEGARIHEAQGPASAVALLLRALGPGPSTARLLASPP